MSQILGWARPHPAHPLYPPMLQKFFLIHTNIKLFHVELLYFKTNVLKLVEGKLHNRHTCRLDFKISFYDVANNHPYKDYVGDPILKKEQLKHVTA